NLENGKKFVIEAPANSKQNVYIKSASLNGKPFTKNFIKHEEIINGGVLKLEMADQPNKNRGIKEEDKPFSVSRK
ncbi:MAG: hypothetical protein EOP43_05830, partial [Sphingobacteriaceae bacterium]